MKKAGRNDPCPCGSGKKYKKCCLTKDEAAARQGHAQRFDTQHEAVRVIDRPPRIEPPPPDPLEAARGELWDEFEATQASDQPALFHCLLAESNLFDAEFAFEMLCAIRDHHDHATFAAALDALRDQRPELYEHDASYYLDWQIGDALADGNLAALPELSAALAATAGRDLDTFYIALNRLIYHGQLALVAQIMAQAWLHVGADQELLPWVPEEFAQRAMDMTLLARIEQTPDLRADDPDLLAALETFAPVDHERLATHLDLLAGQDERDWSLDDFAFQRCSRRDWDDEDEDQPPDPAVQRLYDLSYVFLGAV